MAKSSNCRRAAGSYLGVWMVPVRAKQTLLSLQHNAAACSLRLKPQTHRLVYLHSLTLSQTIMGLTTTQLPPGQLCECSVEGSCYPRNGTYQCVCPDMTPIPANGSCEGHRGKPSSTNSTGVIVITDLFPTKVDKGSNRTEVTSEEPVLSTIITSHESLSPVAIGMITLGVSCLLVLLFVLYRMRHRLHLGDCPGSKESRCHSPMKHAPLTPRYAANPNYYSSAHEGNLLHILKNLEIKRERLLFCREIGEGCFGKVYKGELHEGDGSVPVAVKVLKDNASPEAEADFQREVEIMSTFSHDNILQLLGVVMRDTGTMPWMVFEYMEHGDLADLLRKSSPYLSTEGDVVCKLDKESLMWIAVQVAAGMLYLAQHHFVHRDLATRNCLVGHNLIVKISDFGMSRDIYTCDYYKIGGSRLLPVRWMAPESIMYGKFTLESDVWSFGVLLWEVYTHGKQPYYGHSNEEVVKLILQGILLSPPAECPSYICSIMYGCWRTEPFNRLTFYDIHQQLTEQTVNITNSQLINQSSSIDKDNYLIPKHFHHSITS